MQLNKLLTKQGEEIDGPFIIEPHLFKDDRGLFFESWNKEKFNELVRKNTDFVQDNFSFSQKGVIRGLHYQLNPFPQAKLIRCSKGKIFDKTRSLNICLDNLYKATWEYNSIHFFDCFKSLLIVATYYNSRWVLKIFNCCSFC